MSTVFKEATFSLCVITLLIFIRNALSLPSYDQLSKEAWDFYDKTLEMRRYLHQHPEKIFMEYETSKYIQKQLTEMGVNFTANWGANTNDPDQLFGTGVIAQIGTGKSPCIALRADIDALNMPEYVDLPFKSLNEGYMHACGHDGHAAMLLGAAKLLKDHEHELEGTVKLFFQPAEEGGGGAAMMINEGALTHYPPVQHVYGFHLTGMYNTGEINTGHGPGGAGMDDFIIKITGRGGHAAMHHLTIDPIPPAIAIIRAFNDIYARELYFQIETAGVITVTFFKTSTKTQNVIPDEVKIGGTIRAFNNELMKKIRQRVVDSAHQIAESYGCTASISRQQNVPFPPMSNSKLLFDDYIQNIHPQQLVLHTSITPVMGGEDFAFYAQNVPSLFSVIGSGSGAELPNHPPTNISAHNSYYAIDERALPVGVSLHTHIALQKLSSLSKENQKSYKDEL